jgi:hypothetical protein
MDFFVTSVQFFFLTLSIVVFVDVDVVVGIV